jgi:hypothetical protein
MLERGRCCGNTRRSLARGHPPAPGSLPAQRVGPTRRCRLDETLYRGSNTGEQGQHPPTPYDNRHRLPLNRKGSGQAATME